MATRSGSVTVGVDIGTTSVKAVAVDDDGQIRSRVRLAHGLFHPSADRIEHDAARAWRSGPRRALASVAPEGTDVRGICVAGMVPSMTAVGPRGVPMAPGILYDDARGRPSSAEPGHARDVLGDGAAEEMLRWMSRELPGARGYWPAQAVAAAAIGGPPAIDTAIAASMGSLYAKGSWDRDRLSEIGVSDGQLPLVANMGEAVGTLGGARPGTGAVLAGGTVDALCDQIVSGAVSTGDVLVICGATLVVWAVVDEWVEAPGLWTVPHTVAGKVLVGGASNAGGLFVDWARSVLGRTGHPADRPSRPAPAPAESPPTVRPPGRASSRPDAPSRDDPGRVPVWIPYLRGERVPYHDPTRRSAIHGLDISQDGAGLERAAYEASGFVVRHLLERAGVTGARIVASGGGTRSAPWMQALADCTGLPVDPSAVPEGAAVGAAFVARIAAGLETSFDDAQRWAASAPRVEPDARWQPAAAERYAKFVSLSDQG